MTAKLANRIKIILIVPAILIVILEYISLNPIFEELGILEEVQENAKLFKSTSILKDKINDEFNNIVDIKLDTSNNKLFSFDSKNIDEAIADLKHLILEYSDHYEAETLNKIEKKLFEFKESLIKNAPFDSIVTSYTIVNEELLQFMYQISYQKTTRGVGKVFISLVEVQKCEMATIKLKNCFRYRIINKVEPSPKDAYKLIGYVNTIEHLIVSSYIVLSPKSTNSLETMKRSRIWLDTKDYLFEYFENPRHVNGNADEYLAKVSELADFFGSISKFEINHNLSYIENVIENYRFSLYLSISFLILSIIILIIIYIMLDKWVIIPIKLISDAVGTKDYNILHPLENQKTEFYEIAQILLKDLEQKQKLEISAEQIKKLTETTTAAIFIIDEQRVLYANPKTKELMKLTDNDLLNMNFWDFVHPNYRDYAHQIISKRINGEGVPQNNEIVLISKTGEEIWMQTSATTIDYYGIKAVLITAFDVTSQKKAEILLKESEEKYKTIINNSPNIVMVHKNAKILFANNVGTEQLGYNIDEVIGTSLFAYLDLNAANIVKKRLNEDNLGLPAMYEIDVISKSGKKIPYIIRSQKIRYNNDIAYLTIMTNISEKKELDKKRAESENLYKLIAENTSDIVWIVDAKTLHFKYVSPSVFKIRGYSPEEVMQINLEQAVTPESYKLIKNKIDDSIVRYRAGEESARYAITEIVQPCKNGTFITSEVSSTLFFDENKEFVEMIGITRDITKRKKIESDLLESKEKLNIIMDYSNEYICEINSEGFYTYFNKQYSKLFGTENPNLLNGTNAFNYIHPDDVDNIFSIFKQSISDISDIKLKYRIQKISDKNWIWVESKAHVYKKHNGEISIIILSKDITKERELDAQLKIAQKNSEESYRTKSDFLSIIGHELRTPLNSILGFAELLKERNKNKSEQDLLNEISKNGYSLLLILNDFIDLSTIEAGKMQVENEMINFKEIINSLNNVYQTKANEKGLDFIIRIDPKLPDNLFIDKEKVWQILNNLLSNAVKFTETGKIVFSILTERNKLDKKKIDLVFQVKDTGIGIQPEDYSKIYDPFFQVDKKNTRKYGGTGLGLALTKRLTELMNGNISFISQPEQGTVFSVNLKGVEFGSFYFHPQITKDFDYSKVVFPKATILLVEDMQSSNFIIREFLKSYNFDFIEAYDGRQAIEICQNQKPDLIFMDIQMPVLDGYESTKYLKSNEEYMFIPVIALTAYILTDDLISIREVFDGFLTKPVTKIDLIKEIMKFISYNFIEK